MQPGDTFWIDQSLIGQHLWIVLSEPFQNGEDKEVVLAANVTTVRNSRREDHSCILNAEDHPDLKHDSWVHYESAHDYWVSYLAGPYCKASAPLQPAVFDRVLEGAAKTDRIKLGQLELLEKQGLIK